MNDVMALGATLLHSLWQATLLALILWAVSRQTRLSAAFRYRLAYGTLLLQVGISVATFLHYYTPAHRFESTIKQSVMELVYVAPSATPDVQSSFVDPAFWMTVLVSCWLLSIAAGTTKLLVSFGRVRRMQKSSLNAVPIQLTEKITALAERMGYRGSLSARVGEHVSAPMLVGHLKPVLLLPIAIINQLSTEEAETVILHELAHLRRYDHWANLVQCLIEVLFYYHPAVHWIGARIREEREYCCDDLVLAYGPGRLPYARALLHYGEESLPTAKTALSLTDGGGLLARVRRFLHNQQISYTMKRKFLLLPVLAVVVLVTTAAYLPPVEDARALLPFAEKLVPASAPTTTADVPVDEVAIAAAPTELAAQPLLDTPAIPTDTIEPEAEYTPEASRSELSSLSIALGRPGLTADTSIVRRIKNKKITSDTLITIYNNNPKELAKKHEYLMGMRDGYLETVENIGLSEADFRTLIFPKFSDRNIEKITDERALNELETELKQIAAKFIRENLEITEDEQTRPSGTPLNELDNRFGRLVRQLQLEGVIAGGPVLNLYASRDTLEVNGRQYGQEEAAQFDRRYHQLVSGKRFGRGESIEFNVR